MVKHAIFTVQALLWLGCADTPVGTPPDAGSDAASDTAPDFDASALSKVGEACEGPRDCVQGALCVGASSGGFTCMAECTTPYELCNSGVCLPLTPRPESICYIGGNQPEGANCLTNLDCLAGLLCVGASDEFRCANACDTPDDCASGEFCKVLDTGAAVCATFVGEICSDDNPCENDELACTSTDVAWAAVLPASICTSLGCEKCDDASICMTLDGAPDDLCLPRCTTDADCRFTQGFRCQDAGYCAGAQDPTACREVIGDAKLCLPE